MRNEIDVLQDVFGPDEVPSAAAHDRARAALLNRINEPAPARRRPRWAVRITAVVATAAAAAVGVVALENVGTVSERTEPGRSTPVVAALPFAKPAKAAELLENAAWAASRKPWVTPRDNQFMYVETTATLNRKKILDASPNGALVPGKTETVRSEDWARVDGDVMASRKKGGKLEVTERTKKATWFTIPYADLAAMTTPEKVQQWIDAPKMVGADPDALLMQQVLPPDVEAAIYRWLARRPGVRVNLDSVNLDGRPAIALTWTVEGYLKKDLLFDPETYALIGDRLVAVKDHVSKGDDGTRRIKAGDVFRLVVRNRAGIVDRPGDTP
ncbi:CU044_5270 family protein [Actinoplanes sp. GCM10030250]|uniref:CU044_5270 family protein n=1 Tax=Actinoplanes sp. GCM10030250 TaxID=3273376 RepID=UPI003620FC3E